MKPNERLKKYRKTLGLTLDKYSVVIGCSVALLCRIELGQRMPGRALAVSIEENTTPVIYNPDGSVASKEPIRVAEWGK